MAFLAVNQKCHPAKRLLSNFVICDLPGAVFVQSRVFVVRCRIAAVLVDAPPRATRAILL